MFNIKLFVPTFEDCLKFNYYEDVNVHRDSTLQIVDENDFDQQEGSVKLHENYYEELLNNICNVEDLLPEVWESQSDKDDEDVGVYVEWWICQSTCVGVGKQYFEYQKFKYIILK